MDNGNAGGLWLDRLLEDDRVCAYVCAYMKGCLRMRDKPSVYEVARLAGGSAATVSPVLAGEESACSPGPETRCSPRSPSLATSRAGRPGTWPRGAPACSACASPTWTPKTAMPPTGTTR